MGKYTEDEFFLERFGKEECERRDAYYENIDVREKNLFFTMLDKKEDLFNLIREKTHLRLNFTLVIETIRGNKYLKLESDEIEDSIIALAWKSFRVENFGGNVWYERNKEGYYGSEEDFSKPCPKIGYSMSISFSYTSHSGGYNGTNIGYASFSEETNEWIFKLVKEE